MKYGLLILLLLLVGCTSDICKTQGVTGMYKCRSAIDNKEGYFKITTDVGEYHVIDNQDETFKVCYEGFEPVPEYCLLVCEEKNLCSNK